MKLIDADKLISDMNIMKRDMAKQGQPVQEIINCISAIGSEPTVEAIPLDALCDFLAGYAAPPQLRPDIMRLPLDMDQLKQLWKDFLKVEMVYRRGGETNE